MDFEPKIIAFLCDWGSYRGADRAGALGMKSAPNVRPIRVMCSGRVAPAFIMKAFQWGADGVLILGCHPGECHYGEGNYSAARRVSLLKKMLEQLGIAEARLQLDWVSASEGGCFVSIANDFTAKIRALGPLRRKSE